eukprot:5075174-Prorocentrum_lima.AAC.1
MSVHAVGLADASATRHTWRGRRVLNYFKPDGGCSNCNTCAPRAAGRIRISMSSRLSHGYMLC